MLLMLTNSSAQGRPWRVWKLYSRALGGAASGRPSEPRVVGGAPKKRAVANDRRAVNELSTDIAAVRSRLSVIGEGAARGRVLYPDLVAGAAPLFLFPPTSGARTLPFW